MALNFPGSPTDGQTYVAPNGTTYVYDATNTLWRVQGGDGDNVVFVSATAPVAPTQGKMWWNSVTGAMYIYYIDVDGGQWVPAAATGPAIIAPDQDLSVSSLVASGDVQAASVNGGHAGPSNLIINGAMQVAQRGTSVSGNTSNGYLIDRMGLYQNLGGLNISQLTEAPSGFYNSIRYEVSSTGTATSSTIVTPHQIIEGYSIAHLNWGSSAAKSVTFSFWVRSSVTGTYCAWIRNSDEDRYQPKEFTVSSADTWEKKTLTFTGETSGSWNVTNGRGIAIGICLDAGPERLGTADTWNTSTAFATSNQTNFMSNAGATFDLTGLQLTATDTALPFQHEDYGTTLRKCQRYCYTIQPEDQFQTNQLLKLSAQTSNGDLRVGRIDFPVRMRTEPTISNLRANTTNFSSENFYNRPNSFTYTCNATTAGTAQFLRLDDTSNPAVFDAEL